MKILVKNHQAEPLLVSIVNASGGKLDGLTQLKLTKAKRAVHPIFKDYQDVLPGLKEAHIELEKKGTKKTAPVYKSENGKWVFKSDEDEEKFKEVAGQDNVIDLPYLLQPGDLKQMQLTGAEMEMLLLITEGEATLHVEEPSKNGKVKTQ